MEDRPVILIFDHDVFQALCLDCGAIVLDHTSEQNFLDQPLPGFTQVSVEILREGSVRFRLPVDLVRACGDLPSQQINALRHFLGDPGLVIFRDDTEAAGVSVVRIMEGTSIVASSYDWTPRPQSPRSRRSPTRKFRAAKLCEAVPAALDALELAIDIALQDLGCI